ncbi:MAG: hypothetical protein QOI04_1566 [Verrucomicrobiota bacterium]
MPSVFLCHSSKDKPFARRLADDLARHGVQVWIDEAEVKVGDSLLQTIESGLERSDYVVVILAGSAATRPWVSRELSAAFHLEIARKRNVILPVLLKNARVPLFLRGKKYADFRVSYDLGISELVDAIIRSRHGVHERMENLKCSVLLDILRRDGSLARYSKFQRIRCISGSIDAYVEAFTADGTVTDFSVAPGHIERIWKQSGVTYVDTSLGRVIHRAAAMNRRFTCLYKTSFCGVREYFEEKQHSPTKNLDMVVRFPKGRPPKKWSVGERKGTDLIPIREPLIFGSCPAKPCLRIAIPTPRLFSGYVIQWEW